MSHQQNTFDFGADLHQDPDPGILTEFLSLQNRDNCKNVAFNSINNEKKRSERRKHCALAVVRRSQKKFALSQTRSWGCGTAKI